MLIKKQYFRVGAGIVPVVAGRCWYMPIEPVVPVRAGPARLVPEPVPAEPGRCRPLPEPAGAFLAKDRKKRCMYNIVRIKTSIFSKVLRRSRVFSYVRRRPITSEAVRENP